MSKRRRQGVLPTGTTGTKGISEEVDALHQQCGVYTKPAVVRQILDAVGWTAAADLSKARLLEPASGNGAFVVEAARRLVLALARRRQRLTTGVVAKTITAFELHRGEAEQCREEVITVLRAAGIHHRTAAACARSWIINGDFLLSDVAASSFTHAVGNPPYVRWSKVPQTLRTTYESHVNREMVGGDLFLPFLDRALEALEPAGRCGMICSDRWRFMAFAENFRRKWVPRLTIESEQNVRAADAFVDSVDSYPTILIASKRPSDTPKAPSVKVSGKTLEDLGCVVKVGPALGHTAAYVLEQDEADVEPQLLRPWIDGSEIAEGSITWRGRRVVAMYRRNGELIDPNDFPRLRARLQRFRSVLKGRSIVKHGAPWYRPIDRVRAIDWSRPKLLLPELAKVPRLAIDQSGAIPSHGVYAIFVPDDNVSELYHLLGKGKLAKALEGLAPKVKGDYVRCYRRFLLMLHV